jgi:hypothetical protein
VNGVEIDEPDDAVADGAADQEAPLFSLHAVAGVAVGAPILLKVALGDTTLVALVDTGSTHNFIGDKAAR